MIANTIKLTDWAEQPKSDQDEISELERIVQHDQAAFESLYNRYHPRLYRFVFRMLNNPMQAEEVVSDTLYAVWTGAARFQGKSSVSTWIFGIGFNTALKSVRKAKRHSRFTDSGEDPNLLIDRNADSDPAIRAEVEDDSRSVLNALDSLSTEQRAVAELVALGHSCAEIGEIVGCPSNTVKTRMFHARKKIRNFLQRSQPESSSE